MKRIVLLLLFMPLSAQAAVYEGFDYQGLGLSGNGGTGWAGPWSSNSQALATGLQYPPLAAIGNSLFASPEVEAKRAIDLSEVSSLLDPVSGKIGKDNEVVWFSFLAAAFATGPASASAGLTIYDGDTPKAFIGKPANQPYFWGADLSPSGSFVNEAYPTQNTSLIVGSFFQTQDATYLNMFVNPTVGEDLFWGDGFGVPYDRFTFDSIGFRGSSVFLFDEFRLGPTSQSVMPIPEPSSFVLVLIGAALLLLRRVW